MATPTATPSPIPTPAPAAAPLAASALPPVPAATASKVMEEWNRVDGIAVYQQALRSLVQSGIIEPGVSILRPTLTVRVDRERFVMKEVFLKLPHKPSEKSVEFAVGMGREIRAPHAYMLRGFCAPNIHDAETAARGAILRGYLCNRFNLKSFLPNELRKGAEKAHFFEIVTSFLQNLGGKNISRSECRDYYHFEIRDFANSSDKQQGGLTVRLGRAAIDLKTERGTLLKYMTHFLLTTYISYMNGKKDLKDAKTTAKKG